MRDHLLSADILNRSDSLEVQSSANSKHEGSPSILIVDDQVVQIAALSMFLKKNGLLSDCALSGEAAIKMIKKRMRIDNVNNSTYPPLGSGWQFPYKLVFMDFSMPSMDGIETSKKILQLMRRKGIDSKDPTNSPCICFLSAYSDTPYINQAKAIGIKHYLFKPVANEDLTKLLTDLGLIQT